MSEPMMDSGDYAETTQVATHPSSPLAPEPKTDPHLLGTHLTANGAAFSVYAHEASAVELCLLENTGQRDSHGDPVFHETRWQLRGPFRGIWHGNIPGVRPGQLYGFRAYGPWDPDAGLFYNPQKILLDPYAKAISSTPRLSPRLYAHQVNAQLQPATHELTPDPLDSLPDQALGVVVNTAPFPVAPKPHTSWRRTVIYEAHVKGLTRNLPGLPPELQGTYAGLANPVTIAYLKDLGITAIELLPIHAKFTEPFLQDKDKDNYWGYSTLSYFAPEPSYATARAQDAGPQAVLDEVRGMVSLLHEAGIEVILDVVYNHTCEGGQFGPSLSWRGLDPRRYYVWNHSYPNRLVDFTGCGNTVDFTQNQAVGMMLDSLRYWAGEVGVDGFRFDLGVTLGRNRQQYAVRHPSFVAMATDPVLAGTKLIAEPWDIGPDGWQTGNFPSPFADWNDRYRDTVRRFWLTDMAAQVHGRHAHGPHELATRISGSADMYGSNLPEYNRGPGASVNFICAHDGFTLADLVTYNLKHNEANGEENRDGTTNNNSWNHEFEGHLLRGKLAPAGVEADATPSIDSSRAGIATNAGTATKTSTGKATPPTARPSQAALADTIARVAPKRLRNLRNMWGTMAVSAGTPMILAGDEFGNTQDGNNNAYCQDGPLTWLDWQWQPWQEALHETARYLLGLRAEHPVMRPDSFASGQVCHGDRLPDLSWYDRDGEALSPSGWHDPRNRVVQMLRSGAAWEDVDLLVIFNGSTEAVEINPPQARSRVFRLVWDSVWASPTYRDEDDLSAWVSEVTGVAQAGGNASGGLETGTQAGDLEPGAEEEHVRFAEEVGVTPGLGLDLVRQISELPVTVRGMKSQMAPMSMRIFFAEVPEHPTGNEKLDLLNVLHRVRDK